jgi:hypothetical protein
MAADEVRERGLAGSAVKFMHKPFDEAKLLDAIDRALTCAGINKKSLLPPIRQLLEVNDLHKTRPEKPDRRSPIIQIPVRRDLHFTYEPFDAGVRSEWIKRYEQTQEESTVLSIRSKQGE